MSPPHGSTAPFLPSRWPRTGYLLCALVLGVGVLFADPDPIVSGSTRASYDLRSPASPTQTCVTVASSLSNAAPHWTVFPGVGIARRMVLAGGGNALQPFLAPSLMIGTDVRTEPVLRAGVSLLGRSWWVGAAVDVVRGSRGVVSVTLAVAF